MLLFFNVSESYFSPFNKCIYCEVTCIHFCVSLYTKAVSLTSLFYWTQVLYLYVGHMLKIALILVTYAQDDTVAILHG